MEKKEQALKSFKFHTFKTQSAGKLGQALLNLASHHHSHQRRDTSQSPTPVVAVARTCPEPALEFGHMVQWIRQRRFATALPVR